MEQLVTSNNAVTTYRYVRLGLVALVVFLSASVIDTRCNASDWQNSISAYFCTSSHGVFVASLCAVGASCLVIYKGSTTAEDALLNFSGVLAIVVGLVRQAAKICMALDCPTISTQKHSSKTM